MLQKTYVPQGQPTPPSQIGATLETLARIIKARRGAGEESYTSFLLGTDTRYLLEKVSEEAGEVVEAAQKAARENDEALMWGAQAGEGGETDHLRYEVADLLYHLLVVLERFDIPLDELAAELNMRMLDGERPQGGIRLFEEYIKRGK